jgi:hypothetical protein
MERRKPLESKRKRSTEEVERAEEEGGGIERRKPLEFKM